ncbi:MAG: hypothetical protein CSB01_00630 [Bacteroidia bacterium]|nr:MAG: hypothetical protein CSB01_00630 [Bacteroidia bacterium]
MILNIDIIQEKLRDLNYPQALSFCYLLSKKSFPNYALFSEFEEFGKPEVLYSSLVELRKHIAYNANEAKLQELMEMLLEDEDIAPDTDDFPGNLAASLALDSVGLLYHSFKFALTKKHESLCHVAKTSLNSVEMYFVVENNIDQNLPRDEYNKIVNEAIVVQSELLQQSSLIEKIKSVGETNNRIYTHIKINDSRLAEHSLYSNFIYA